MPIVEVSDYTGFPEIMDGRVKTLHPKIHGALLGRRDQDQAVMQEHGIEPIDLLVVNLYPFAKTIERPGCSFADAVEQVDIGGPTMLRSAAKNFESVSVVTEPSDYANIIAEMKENDGAVSKETNFKLAVKVFETTSGYDAMITKYLKMVEAGEIDAQF